MDIDIDTKNKEDVVKGNSNETSIIMHDRQVLPDYLSEDNRRELVSLNFNTKDMWNCWLSNPNTDKIKGKCTGCGIDVRIPPYLARFNKKCNYQKDQDKPHAMFMYVGSLDEMEAINPQHTHIAINNYNCEDANDELDDYDRDGPTRQSKRAAVVPDIDLVKAMEMLETTIEKAASKKRAKLLVPVCFECYLAAKEEVKSRGYRLPSIENIPDLETKQKSKHHYKFNDLSGMDQGIIILERLHQRLAWCTLPGSRHCIHVRKVGVDGKGGYKVCGKRRGIIKPDTMKGQLMINDYYCLEHKDAHSDIRPASKYFGMFSHLSIF